TATDDRTLVVKTKQPQATMLALDVPIVPAHVCCPVAAFCDGVIGQQLPFDSLRPVLAPAVRLTMLGTQVAWSRV
ncbi:hypothetical protein ABTZ99_26270, partial [Actinosynnema sp. NPDC002837]